MSGKESTVSVRVPTELLQLIQALAIVHGETAGSEIRRAMQEYVSSCREDPEFNEKLDEAKERQLDALRRLERA